MAGIGLLLDPTAEGTGTQLNIADGTTFVLVDAPQFPPPDLDPQWATSSDTEGALLAATKHQNRTITLPIRVYGGTAAGLDTQLAKLQQKVGKIVREGGTLKITTPAGKTVVFDLLDAQITIPINQRLVTKALADTELRFTAKPYPRLPNQTFSTHPETALPVLVFTETTVQGDVPGLGRLTLTETQSKDRWWWTWGIQSRYYDSAATAKLFYEAEALTPLGNFASTVVSGTSGGNALQGNIGVDYQSILSTQASGGGAHMTHVGDYRVWARVQVPASGTLSLALDWAAGDFRRPARNDAVTITATAYSVPYASQWIIVDLGLVSLPAVSVGSQRWEGRLVAKSTVSSDLFTVDWVSFVPVSEGSGEAATVSDATAPLTISVADAFAGTAALTGRNVEVGAGAWAGSGDADDFAVAAGVATRVAISDVDQITGRRATAGSTSFTDVAVQATMRASAYPSGLDPTHALFMGLLARYVDASNFAFLVFRPGATTNADQLSLWKVKAGVSSSVFDVGITDVDINTNIALRLVIGAGGQWQIFSGATASTLELVMGGQDNDFATGGTLASGKVGLYDALTTTTVSTRTYDDFKAWVPNSTPVLASGRDAVVLSDNALRQNAAGTVYARPDSYEGDYLRIPPAGQESRTLRMIVIASRTLPTLMADSAIDDLSGQLTVTPRVLVVPE